MSDTNLEKRISMMDNAFSDYLMKKLSDDSLERKLSTILTSLDFDSGDKEFEVCIVKNNGKEPFFGMRVFPVIEEANKITSSLANEKKSFSEICKMWKTIKQWYLEIDNGVFDRTQLNFIPKELTALTLHEVGHVIYSDKIIEQFYRAYQDSYMRMKITDKAAMKYLYMLYTIPLSATCMMRHWTNGKNEINQEKFADRVLIENGYSEYLLTALNKIIKAYGNDVGQSEEAGNRAIQSSINWCNLNVTDITKRRNSLKDDLFYQTMKTNSTYVKALSMKILHDLSVGLRENYTGAVVESYGADIVNDKGFFAKYTSFYDLAKYGSLETRIKAATESYTIALESKHDKITLPSQYDIDAISVECDRITNHHDRIYVLDLIYDKLTQLDQFESMIVGDRIAMRKYSEKINSMRNELQELRTTVLGKHNLDTEYKLFVKYPKGYEG